MASPLHEAVEDGDGELAACLIENGASVNGRDERGNTPLNLAAFKCNAQMMRCLMEKGADSSIRCGDGEFSYTPLLTACEEHFQGGLI